MSAKVNGAFSGLVEEAVKIERELREVSSLAGGKLTGQAYVREAMQIANIDPGRLRKLREQIENGGTEMTAVFSALRMMTGAVRSPNYPHPPRSARALRYMIRREGEAQLARLGASPFDLFAIAAQIVAEKHPAAFGVQESSDAYNARLLELTLKRDELLQRIENEYRPDDLLLSDWDAAGKCRATFKLDGADTGVSIVPKEDAGRRLVDWRLGQKAHVT